jgi:hypothetical protein
VRVHVVLKNPTDNSGPEYGAQTTDDGHFSISGVPATRAYILNAARVGYSIGVSDLNQLRLWVDTRPQVPEGDWYKDFGSFKICDSGSYPKTFLLRR